MAVTEGHHFALYSGEKVPFMVTWIDGESCSSSEIEASKVYVNNGLLVFENTNKEIMACVNVDYLCCFARKDLISK